MKNVIFTAVIAALFMSCSKDETPTREVDALAGSAWYSPLGTPGTFDVLGFSEVGTYTKTGNGDNNTVFQGTYSLEGDRLTVNGQWNAANTDDGGVKLATIKFDTEDDVEVLKIFFDSGFARKWYKEEVR